MLSAISNIAKIKEAIAKADTTRFNSTLPISIKVLQKLESKLYQLQLGNKEFTTRSLKELEVGAKYWGDFNKSKEGIINISNLLKKPLLLQKDEMGVKFHEKALLELVQTKEPKGVMKAFLLEQLSTANSKQEFLQLSNMLVALEEGVITIPYKDGSLDALLQYKRSKKQDKNGERESVEFYAAFDNLGPIEGNLYLYDDTLRGVIGCQYAKSAGLLESIKEELSFVVQINTTQNIQMLHALDSSLLDVKG
jgi:hypothetical protein